MALKSAKIACPASTVLAAAGHVPREVSLSQFLNTPSLSSAVMRIPILAVSILAWGAETPYVFLSKFLFTKSAIIHVSLWSSASYRFHLQDPVRTQFNLQKDHFSARVSSARHMQSLEGNCYCLVLICCFGHVRLVCALAQIQRETRASEAFLFPCIFQMFLRMCCLSERAVHNRRKQLSHLQVNDTVVY